jgi:methylated-DNA-[protein]-cysteine S-methyltransferase
MTKYSFYYDSPIGRLYIAEAEGFITDVSFKPVTNAVEQETPLISRAVEMLREYFDGKRKSFDGLPLRTGGTDFQKKAWDALLGIPYGETRSYKEQAEAVGNVKACRAVGTANGRNPISIIIPCHRVIGSNKTLTGYGGGLDIKKALLELESKAD